MTPDDAHQQPGGGVRALRLVVTAQDHDAAGAFCRDTLGLPQREDYSSENGRVVVLEAGRATLEIADPAQTDLIDRVEVGRRVAGHLRVAFEAPGDLHITLFQELDPPRIQPSSEG